MNLPSHVEAQQINDNQYIVTNKITFMNIKIGIHELNYLSSLHTKSINQEHPRFQLSEAQQSFLEQKFNELGFLSKDVSLKIHKKKRSKNLARFPLFYLDPEKTLDRIAFFTKPLMTRGSLIAIILLNLISFIIFGLHQEDWLKQVSIENLSLSNIIIIYLMMIGTLVLHEFSHAITCHYFGGRVKEMGAMMFYFNLALYCDVSSSYLFKEKYKKIIVIMAGLISQTVIGSFAIIIYYLGTTLGYHFDVLLFFSVLNLGMIVLNLIPLVKLDGYWLFAQLIGVTNLRDKSFKYLISLVIPKYRELTFDYPKNELRIFKWYGWTSLAFTSFLWGYGIYYFSNLGNHFSDWLGTSISLVLIFLVCMHIYKSIKLYITQINKELGTIHRVSLKENIGG